MIALAIDTAGPVLGVGLWDRHREHERTLRIGRGAEEHIPALIEELCQAASVLLRDVRAIGVAIGPGAFTGLRVGVAAAGGLASALSVPIWPAQSLLPRAARVGFGGDLLVLLDARKGRVYAAAWHNETLVRPPADVPPEEALAWLPRRGFRATGEGALVYREAIEACGGTVVANPDLPGTGRFARAAAEAVARGAGIEALALRTEYLREPDAVARAPVDGS